MILRSVVWIFSAVTLVLCADLVSGQNYPNKPIRIFTADAGGGVDFTTRIIAQGISGLLGQQVIVENRAGNVVLPAQPVAKAPPDGYTLLFFGGPLWLLPLMQDNIPYDPVRDFSPITLAISSPNTLAVHPSLPVKSVKDLIALAEARPGALNYGSGNSGSISHLAGELFKTMAGVNIVRIPYKGGTPALNALISGEVQLMFPAVSTVGALLKSGRLKVLAVASAQPSALLPGLPTIAASGLPGYQSVSMYGMFAPAKTPEAIINRLNQEIVRVLNTPEAKNKLFNAGAEVIASSPEQFAAAIRAEMTTLGKIISDRGIKVE